MTNPALKPSPTGYFITGTDTDVGKTIACGWCLLHLKNSRYWKPVQSGLDEGTDTQTLKNLTQFPAKSFLQEAYLLKAPLSPHEAAIREGESISLEKINLPSTKQGPLIVEGAGGILVPLNNHDKMIDLAQKLGLPVIVVARSTLGTINHTLLTLWALRQANLPIYGVILNGPMSPHNRTAIEQFGHVPIIAEIPRLASLNVQSLRHIHPEIPL